MKLTEAMAMCQADQWIKVPSLADPGSDVYFTTAKRQARSGVYTILIKEASGQRADVCCLEFMERDDFSLVPVSASAVRWTKVAEFPQTADGRRLGLICLANLKDALYVGGKVQVDNLHKFSKQPEFLTDYMPTILSIQAALALIGSPAYQSKVIHAGFDFGSVPGCTAFVIYQREN